MTTDANRPTAQSLWHCTWSMPVLLTGITFLLAWRSTALAEQQLVASMPWWLLLVLLGVLPHLFLLIYPLATCRERLMSIRRLPKITRLFKEGGIAIAVLAVVIVLLNVAEHFAVGSTTGTPESPSLADRTAGAPANFYTYMFLLSSFLYAPISEEFFYRGFLFNALRARMPVLVAVIVESLIFGMTHFNGPSQTWFATFFGLVVTLVYWWRKTLLAPLFIHAIFNAIFAASVLFSMQAHANSAVLGVTADASASNCVVANVVPNSPAAVAGIRPGDIITHLDNRPIKSFNDLLENIRFHQPGDTISLSLIREEEPISVSAVLISRRALSKENSVERE